MDFQTAIKLSQFEQKRLHKGVIWGWRVNLNAISGKYKMNIYKIINITEHLQTPPPRLLSLSIDPRQGQPAAPLFSLAHIHFSIRERNTFKYSQKQEKKISHTSSTQHIQFPIGYLPLHFGPFNFILTSPITGA